jgi:transposase-like protein
MAFVQQEMTSLIIVDPDEARRRIVKAFRKAEASIHGAAEVLGCGERTLHRWINKLKMRPEIAKLERQAEREGWHYENTGKKKAG